MNMKRFPITARTIEGEEIEVTADNRDVLRWENRRARENWPTTQDAPMFWSTFMLWSALARNNRAGGMDFETFADTIECVFAGVEDVDPTSRAASNT